MAHRHALEGAHEDEDVVDADAEQEEGHDLGDGRDGDAEHAADSEGVGGGEADGARAHEAHDHLGVLSVGACGNTKGYSSTYLAMGFASVRAGTQTRRAVFGYPPEH